MHRELTTQEVIIELNKLKTGAPCSDVDKRDKAIEIAKEAVVSAEARKPNYYELEGGGFECPRCYELVDDAPLSAKSSIFCNFFKKS